MSKNKTMRKQQIEQQKITDQLDTIWGIKKNPETLQDHVWNDKMKDYQTACDLAMIQGVKK